MRADQVWAVIPALNAESSIGEVIDRTKKYVPRVIVVNDGSTDRTAEVSLSRGIELISVPVNRGKGYALRRGFGHALNGGCRAILALDADGQHDPGDIPKFLQAHEQNADAILIGSRMAQAECFPRQRYYSNRVAAFFISQALGQYLEDTQCGFRLYPAKVIASINLTTCHFQTETEVLLRAAPGRTTWWSLSATGKSPYVLTPEGRRPPNSPKRKFFGLESGEDSIYVCQFQKNFQ